jgi:hypothetical protein
MRASAASVGLRDTGQCPSARRRIAQVAAALLLLAAGSVSFAQTTDAVEAPLSADESGLIALSDGAGQTRQQPAETLIGRVDVAGPTNAYVPTVSVERTRLPAGRDWPGGTGVDSFGRPYTEMGGVNYRWWLRRGRADLGIGVGTVGYLVAPIEGLAASPHSLIYDGPHALVYAGPHTLAHTAPTVTVGWRYQLNERSTVFADALGARRSSADDRSDFYSTKVGMEWKERKSRLGFEQGSLGLRLDSGYRMTLRTRKGGLGVYLRGQF